MKAPVIVKLLAAMICFSGHCYHALVGKSTPTGTFDLIPYYTIQKGYDGNVLAFAQTKHTIFAVHQVWLLEPWEHRMKRIRSDNPRERVITHGCINLLRPVYLKLRKCCSFDKMVIEK